MFTSWRWAQRVGIIDIFKNRPTSGTNLAATRVCHIGGFNVPPVNQRVPNRCWSAACAVNQQVIVINRLIDDVTGFGYSSCNKLQENFITSSDLYRRCSCAFTVGFQMHIATTNTQSLTEECVYTVQSSSHKPRKWERVLICVKRIPEII